MSEKWRAQIIPLVGKLSKAKTQTEAAHVLTQIIEILDEHGDEAGIEELVKAAGAFKDQAKKAEG